MKAEADVVSMTKTETGLSVVRTHRAIVLREALEQATEQRALVKEFVEKHMIEGVDYGPIPGAGPGKVLLKPGAEKLVELFRCTPKFHLLRSEETWEGNGFFNYMFRARIVSRDAKEVLAEGYGSANSRESKHRWRNASRKCPSCQKDAIIEGKPEYGGGWLCFKKKGGCGAKYQLTDPAIALQAVGKTENTDAADLANTVLKMAKKRALVDAAIALARCSDMFTQDLEDQEPPPQPEEQPSRGESSLPPPAGGTRTQAVTEKLGQLVQPKAETAVLLESGGLKGRAVREIPQADLELFSARTRDWLADGRNKKGRPALERDLGRFTAELARRAAQPVPGEPPPPSDADAPSEPE